MTTQPDSAQQPAVKAANALTDWAASDQGKKMLPYLLTGGAGAVAGGLLTSKRKKRLGESRGAHLARVLLNAGLVGGGAAGAAALASKGLGELTGSAAEEARATSQAPPVDNRGPLAVGLENMAFSPITAGAAGIAGLKATDKGKGYFGAGRQDATSALQSLSDDTGKTLDQLKNLAPDKVRSLTPKTPGAKTTAELLDLAHKARLVTADGGWKGAWQHLTRGTGGSGRGILSTLGNKPGRIPFRVLAGLAAAAVPGVVGAMVTKDHNAPVTPPTP